MIILTWLVIFLPRAATAALVEKQSHEMMELIQERRSEYMVGSSLYLDGEDAPPYPARAPQPQPPLVSKFHIYTDPAEFTDVDKIAISVRLYFVQLDRLFHLT